MSDYPQYLLRTTGKVMCGICYDVHPSDDRSGLLPVQDEPGRFWDICKGGCAGSAGLVKITCSFHEGAHVIQRECVNGPWEATEEYVEGT